jgi:hypothetical protein
MAPVGSYTLMWLLLQAAGVVSVPGDIFSPAEKAQIEKTAAIDGRIKVYETASKRIQQTLHESVTKEQFEPVPDILKLWTSLLAKSLEDIEANLRLKKKSRALMDYEIHLRKAIADTQSLQIRAPVEQQDAFASCLARAETIRKSFVKILFQN